MTNQSIFVLITIRILTNIDGYCRGINPNLPHSPSPPGRKPVSYETAASHPPCYACARGAAQQRPRGGRRVHVRDHNRHGAAAMLPWQGCEEHIWPCCHGRMRPCCVGRLTCVSRAPTSSLSLRALH